jgi:hypothetical protein
VKAHDRSTPAVLGQATKKEGSRKIVLSALERLQEAPISGIVALLRSEPLAPSFCGQHVGALLRDLELSGRVCRRLVPERGALGQRVTVSLWRLAPGGLVR